jgi:hypothetical protein
MKFMVVWKTVPGKYKTAVDQFLKRAAQRRPKPKQWVAGTFQDRFSAGT